MSARSFAVGSPLPPDESTPAKAARISSMDLASCSFLSKRNASRTTSPASSNSPDLTWLLTKSSKADGKDTFIHFNLPRKRSLPIRIHHECGDSSIHLTSPRMKRAARTIPTTRQNSPPGWGGRATPRRPEGLDFCVSINEPAAAYYCHGSTALVDGGRSPLAFGMKLQT